MTPQLCAAFELTNPLRPKVRGIGFTGDLDRKS